MSDDHKPTEAFKASVIIPVKNGGPLLVKVMAAVLGQQTPWPFELLIIDSGSRDGSVEAARRLGAKVVEISPASFGHGRTRNQAASLTSGEFIVFLTHDALPADEHWLANLVAAMEMEAPAGSRGIAGAFGRHLAYDECNPATARDIDNFFQGFQQQPNPVWLAERERYRQEVGYRQMLHYFSSNNACLRRSVWQQIPLPEVDFAEDQQWAKAIIEAGYAKAYAHDAAVYHSHNLGVIESYTRAFDESSAFKRYFGYDLMPKLTDVGRQWVRLLVRDLRWVRAAERSKLSKIRWGLRIPLLNLAKLLGMYVGNHQNRLPRWLVQHSSRDKALQHSR